MTTLTKPAQASITASGWTVTVTHVNTVPPRHFWHAVITADFGYHYAIPVDGATLAAGEPDPLAALEKLAPWLRYGIPNVPYMAAQALAEAIETMYEAAPCPDCQQPAGEPCHPDCSTSWT